MSQLMTERAKFETWLRELDAKREARPAHVVDRVRADYSERLEKVLEKLKEHSDALQQHSASLASRLHELEAAEQDLVDRRAEAELRAHVGELSTSEVEAASKSAESELAKIKADQQLIARDLNRIQELLSGATGGQVPAPRPENFDELSFLKSVVGTTTPQPANKVEQPKAPPAPSDGDGAQPASRPTPALAPLIEKAAAAPLIGSPKPTPASGSPSATDDPTKIRVVHQTPLTIRSSGVVEQPKTLKCAECGAMNYSSEWYCERCGAELASI